MKIVELMLGNVLMLNLLIAIYGEVFASTKKDSNLNWKYEFFLLSKHHQARFTTFYIEKMIPSNEREKIKVHEQSCIIFANK